MLPEHARTYPLPVTELLSCCTGLGGGTKIGWRHQGLSMIAPNGKLSLSEFKRDTSQAIRRLRATKEPQVLEVNGRASLVVQDAVAYRRLVERLSTAEERLAVTEALVALDEGERGATIEETLSRVEKRAAVRRRHRS